MSYLTSCIKDNDYVHDSIFEWYGGYDNFKIIIVKSYNSLMLIN